MIDRHILLILLVLFVSNTIYGLASPFLPTELEEKGIDSIWTGIIFSAYAVATIFTSLGVGCCLNTVGHNKIIFWGSLIMAICIIAFGQVENLEAKESIIIISIALRLGQGSASGMINTSAYGFASTAYPDSVEKVVSVLEGVVGIGITISPILGSFIYEYVGFADTFYIFGAAMVPIAFLILFLLPDPKKVKAKRDGTDEIKEENKEGDNVNTERGLKSGETEV